MDAVDAGVRDTRWRFAPRLRSSIIQQLTRSAFDVVGQFEPLGAKQLDAVVFETVYGKRTSDAEIGAHRFGRIATAGVASGRPRGTSMPTEVKPPTMAYSISRREPCILPMTTRWRMLAPLRKYQAAASGRH